MAFHLMISYDVRMRIEMMSACPRRVGAWEGHLLLSGPDGLRSRRAGRGSWPARRRGSSAAIPVVPHRRAAVCRPSHARAAFLSCLIYYSGGDGGKCNLQKSGARCEAAGRATAGRPRPVVASVLPAAVAADAATAADRR